MAAGPCHFHVLVPATPVDQYRSASVVPSGPTGFATPVGWETGGDEEDRKARTRAQVRLGEELDRLRKEGAEADGEVGSADPLQAIREVLNREQFDEILLATLPVGVSRWLRRDLPHRVARSVDVPVTHVVSEAGPPGLTRWARRGPGPGSP